MDTKLNNISSETPLNFTNRNQSANIHTSAFTRPSLLATVYTPRTRTLNSWQICPKSSFCSVFLLLEWRADGSMDVSGTPLEPASSSVQGSDPLIELPKRRYSGHQGSSCTLTSSAFLLLCSMPVRCALAAIVYFSG